MIEVKNLVKRYGEHEAVRGVSFTVEKGKIYGFLGPNGAGKSTTMNMITGCLAATEGEITINGYDIYEDPVEAKQCIGYLPEQPPLYPDMTVEEYLEFVGMAKGLRGEKLYKACDRAIAKTGLTDVADRLIKNLSKGYKQRVGIAQAIISDPEIIILDEPTVGLDPIQIIEIRDLIRELGADHTVILSSHILTEISAVCDYIIIIAKGRIVASDTIENLTQMYEGKSYIDIQARGGEKQIRAALDSMEGAGTIEVEKSEEGICHVRISCEKGNDIRDAVFFRFADARIPIIGMNSEEVTLEKVFLELTGDKDEEPSVPSYTAPVSETGDDTEEPVPQTDEIPEAVSDTEESDSGDDYTPLFGGKN